MLKADEIVLDLRRLGEPRRVAALRRSGVGSPAFGVALPALRSMAKQIGPNHQLARELWQKAAREPRILASLIDEPERVTATQLERWATGFDSWEICDQCCQNLFWRTPFAFDTALAWTRRPEEFVKRAGLVLVAVLAVHDDPLDDDTFVHVLPMLVAAADDERVYVQKGASWALRQIGKRNEHLCAAVLAAVAPCVVGDSRASRRVARDVARELGRRAALRGSDPEIGSPTPTLSPSERA
jgi:3-methyladenine DNA glycosylase AlkD